MKTDFNHCESVYWVFTQLCNDTCDHCYNLSGPQGERITDEDCLAIVGNLPDRVDRLIISGGEPLAEWKKLLSILGAVRDKFGDTTQVMLQTNGDLINGPKLDTLLEMGVSRIDIASIDRYHKHQGERIESLKALFLSRNMTDADTQPLIEKDNYLRQQPSFGFWGATEELWLGGNWARGRAMQKNIWKKDPNHNFCSILSGARGFLGGHPDMVQEISIQLWKINPCCPGTKLPMGDARTEKVADVLARVSESPVFQRLNDGDPWKMGESLGVSEAYARERTEKLQNICLWCDEFFAHHPEVVATPEKQS